MNDPVAVRHALVLLACALPGLEAKLREAAVHWHPDSAAAYRVLEHSISVLRSEHERLAACAGEAPPRVSAS
ncbi:MAG TPA: hypothetical protein VGD76_17815 [Ramlibacter sp.]